jgi:hypothetical protein
MAVQLLALSHRPHMSPSCSDVTILHPIPTDPQITLSTHISTGPCRCGGGSGMQKHMLQHSCLPQGPRIDSLPCPALPTATEHLCPSTMKAQGDRVPTQNRTTVILLGCCQFLNTTPSTSRLRLRVYLHVSQSDTCPLHVRKVSNPHVCLESNRSQTPAQK